MVDPRWRMFVVPFLITNDFIMTSLPLLRIIVFANFAILSYTLVVKFFRFMAYFERHLDSANKFNNMTFNDVILIATCVVIVSVKLCLEVRNDGYAFLCNVGGRVMSSFEVIEGSPF